jgi:quinol monooxygenase YgiN
MTIPRLALAVGVSVISFSILLTNPRPYAQATPGLVVRLAELEIDPAQLENYKAALREEIESSIRSEPGVLTLYAVALKGNPTQIRLFETYADMGAYKAHLETAHFKKYKSTTKDMVRSLKLIETEPILLGAKRQ